MAHLAHLTHFLIQKGLAHTTSVPTVPSVSHHFADYDFSWYSITSSGFVHFSGIACRFSHIRSGNPPGLEPIPRAVMPEMQWIKPKPSSVMPKMHGTTTRPNYVTLNKPMKKPRCTSDGQHNENRNDNIMSNARKVIKIFAYVPFMPLQWIFHDVIASNARIKLRQMPEQNCVKCPNKIASNARKVAKIFAYIK